MNNFFDIIIVGAGPAGISCALSLAKADLRIALLEKEIFPRDKICGDALSVDVINQLPLLSNSLAQNFSNLPNKIPAYGVSIFSPDHSRLDIPFTHSGVVKCGYIASRIDFDNLLFEEVKLCKAITIIEDCKVSKLDVKKDEVSVHTNQGKFKTKLIVGADGANSIVKKVISQSSIKRKHHSAGLRIYYKGVTGFHEQSYIELYFLKEILPGYIWVFPLPEGKANVGIGLLSSKVSKRRLDLKYILKEYLLSHPILQERFKNATPLETIKGHGLPLGSLKRDISDNRVLLLGDAAGLIDPFTGEGIGNAIRSGRIAAAHIQNAFLKNDFSKSFNLAYDKEIYHRMGKEFKVSATIQRLCCYPSLFNFVVRKAKQNKYWHQFLINSLADLNEKSQLTKPWFYYKLLFNN